MQLSFWSPFGTRSSAIWLPEDGSDSMMSETIWGKSRIWWAKWGISIISPKINSVGAHQFIYFGQRSIKLFNLRESIVSAAEGVESNQLSSPPIFFYLLYLYFELLLLLHELLLKKLHLLQKRAVLSFDDLRLVNDAEAVPADGRMLSD
jgi:hypothetical protein